MAARLPDPTSPHAVADGMFRALAWLRIVVTLNMLGLTWWRRDNFDHLGLAVAVNVALVLWTAFTVWAYAESSRRRPALLVADLTIATAALLSTPFIKGDDFHATLPGFWVAGVVLTWGVRWRWTGGLVAASVIAVADLGMRGDRITQTNYANVFLLMIGGPLLGYLAGVLHRLAAERDAAQRAAALADERARLARVVHDGVLQVLALVQRRGPELGPEGAELGRLAGEQESRLRALVQVGAETGPRAAETGLAGDVDVAALVTELATRRTPIVHVATPAEQVLLPGHVAGELLAAAGAALDNVAVHVGEHEPAWVLLEDLGSSVVLTVRDEGPGIPAGRLEAAEAEGRLGVCQSIAGRLLDLGGAARHHSGPSGTEWELEVPR